MQTYAYVFLALFKKEVHFFFTHPYLILWLALIFLLLILQIPTIVDQQESLSPRLFTVSP